MINCLGVGITRRYLSHSLVLTRVLTKEKLWPEFWYMYHYEFVCYCVIIYSMYNDQSLGAGGNPVAMKEAEGFSRHVYRTLTDGLVLMQTLENK